MLQQVADFVAEVVGSYARQLIVGVGPLFALAAVLFFAQRLVQGLWVRAAGWKAVVYGTGWLGTPIHELSHYVVGKLTGVEIVEVKPFSPDEKTGVLGYVRYRNPRLELKSLHKVIGTFLMGIAPIFGGSLVLVGLWALLIVPSPDGRFAAQGQAFVQSFAHGTPAQIVDGARAVIGALYQEIFKNPQDPRTWIFCYAAMAVGTHLAPSQADLEGGWRGFLVLLGLGLVVNVGTAVAGINPQELAVATAEALMPLTLMVLFALVLTLGNLALAGAVSTVVKARSKPS